MKYMADAQLIELGFYASYLNMFNESLDGNTGFCDEHLTRNAAVLIN